MHLSRSFQRATLALFFSAAVFTTTPTTAAILFESGTLGPTGIPSVDLSTGATPGTSVDFTVYVGVRFQLNQPVETEHIGGHFVSADSGTFFGAIVELDDANDTPDSDDFSSSDFLGATLLNFPSTTSDEVFGDLMLSLDPGWYALVFGSGLFGANGDGSAVRNGTDIGNPTYIAAQPFSGGSGWVDISFSLPNHRFVVAGQIVPETSSIVLASIASLLFLIHKRSSETRSPSE